jgi:hypothetical protein
VKFSIFELDKVLEVKYKMKPLLVLRGHLLGLSAKKIALACRIRIETTPGPQQYRIRFLGLVGHRNNLKLSIADTLADSRKSLGDGPITIKEFRGVNAIDHALGKKGYLVNYFKYKGDWIRLNNPIMVRSF